MEQFEAKLPPDEIESYFNKMKLTSSVWFDVKPPIQSFLGRKRKLHELHHLSRQTQPENVVFQKMTVICGLGGVGKTQLVAKYIQNYLKEYNYNIVWINAETFESLLSSFTRLACELGIYLTVEGNKKDGRTIVNEVYKFFARKTSLFIFDNANQLCSKDGIQGIYEFLPQEKPNTNIPYIFVTSRRRNWGDIKILNLSTFTKKEAAELIKSLLNIKGECQSADVAKLSYTLQNLPLALQQATSYILCENSKLRKVKPQDCFTIEDYLKEFDLCSDKVKTLLNHEFPDGSDI